MLDLATMSNLFIPTASTPFLIDTLSCLEFQKDDTQTFLSVF